MMKNLFLRLCLIMIVFLSLSSCRQDILHEEEKKAYNNSGAFQLKSNRISLNESKHKAALLPEFEKAEVGIKAFEKKNMQSKGIFYGNGFSIDTDDVIYIENGPNYHTYTFKITRDNAPANAPVENLVLTPLPDGTYKEFLVIYNLTESEKIKIKNEEFVDTKGKTQIIQLAKENYTNVLSRSESCSYQTVTINVSCSSGHHMPGQSGCTLTGNDRARSYSVMALVCSGSNGPDGGGPSDSGGGSSSGGGGGGEPCTDCPPATNTPEPCTTPQIPQGPVDPSFNIDPSGCGTGIPTQPNLPVRNNPCQRIKAVVNKQKIQDSLIAMKAFAQTSLRKERGFQELKSGTLLNGTVKKNLQVELGIGSNSLGTIHVHPLKGIAMFSAGDIVTFLHLLREQDATTIGSTYAGMVSASGTYFINFTGTASDIPPAMTEIQEEVYIENLVENYKKNYSNFLKEEGKKIGDQLSNTNLEKLFFKLINNMGLDGKINIIKEENGNTSTIIQNADGTTTPNPC